MPDAFFAALPLLLPLALLGGLAGGSTGFGTYLVIGPALWASLSPTESIGVALALGLPSWILFWSLRKDVPWRRCQSILVWALPGLLLGIALHLLLADNILQTGAALAIFAAVALRYILRRAIHPASAGLLAGGLSTSVGFNGPPVFLGLADQSERALRGGTIFCLLILSLLVSATLLGVSGAEFIRGYAAGLVLMPLTGLGVFLGNLLARSLGTAIEWIAVVVSLGGALLLLLEVI